MKKRCANCKRKLSIDEFWRNHKSPDGLQYKCKECSKAYKKTPAQKEAQRIYAQGDNCKDNLVRYRVTEKYRLTHNEQQVRRNKEQPDIHRKAKLKIRYGITLAEYDEMFEIQNGVCAICELPEITRRLSVDHDHKTGEVRALLCDRCNRFLGAVGDDVALLLKGVEYLRQKRGNKTLMRK